MIRGFLAILFLTTYVAAAPAEHGQLDASPALFSVMAAINAAGYDADIDSAANAPLRLAVRQALAAQNIPSLPALKSYFQAHRKRDWTSELNQYISLALCLGDPPEFAYRYKQDELPPDVVPLDGFRTLLQTFYKEANLDQLWRKAQPAYEEAIARYHQPAMNALLQVNAYLRTSTSPQLGTSFQIYVDLLSAPNQVQTRSYKNDYYVVLTPSAEPRADDVRHAYLHYQLDPLAVRYAAELEKKKSLLDFAEGAPSLEPHYKSDFPLLATECLIKAVESRLAPPSQRQAVADQALREGFILTPAFTDLLPAYEKQEQSLRFYYRDLISGIDLKRETQRLDQVQFASAPAVRRAKPVAAPAPPELTEAARTIEQAEEEYRKRDLEQAKAGYLRALQETEDKPLHARAYYGLARIAALQKDPDTAEKLFQKTLESSPDAQVQAWAHVYLGRLADAAGSRDQARGHYQSALEVPGASDAARRAAEQGLREAFNRPAQQP